MYSKQTIEGNMDISHFYKLSIDYIPSAILAGAINIEESFGNQDFDDDRLFLGDYHGISFPISFKQRSGRKLTDVLRIGYVWPFLISERLKHILEEHYFTGWKTFPVKVFDKNDIEIPGYYGFSVTGKCGPIDYIKSQIIEKSIHTDGPLYKYYKGLYVGLDQWDGSDFFLPGANKGIIITERVADALTKNKLTNIKITNLLDIEVDDDTVELYMKNQQKQKEANS